MRRAKFPNVHFLSEQPSSILTWNRCETQNTRQTHHIHIKLWKGICEASPLQCWHYTQIPESWIFTTRASEWQASTLKGHIPETNIFTLELSTWLIWQLQHLRQVNIVEACSIQNLSVCWGDNQRSTQTCLLVVYIFLLSRFFVFLLLFVHAYHENINFTPTTTRGLLGISIPWCVSNDLKPVFVG